MVGGVVSILSVMDALAVLPAASVTVPENTWFAPSVAATFCCGQLVMGEAEGAHRKLIVTDVVFHPAAFGAGDAVAVIRGAVLSMFSVTQACAVLPATSTAFPQNGWLAPSVLTGIDAGHVATPEPASEHVKLTTTLLLFQPAAL